MLVNFHEDLINLEQLCFDLRNDGVAVISTMRPNLSAVAKTIEEQIDATILALSVEDCDLDWHHYLINADIVDFDSGATPDLILKAVERWKRARRPFPFAAYV